MSILHLLSTDGFISVNKILIKKIGLEHAVIIGELSSEYDYYSKRRELTKDGYFFSTVKNIEERTTIKEKRQRLIMNDLEEMNLIHTVKRGMPSKRYIKLNEIEIFKLFQENGQNGQNEGYSSAKMTELVPPVEATNKNIINKNIINNKDINTYSPKFSTFDMEIANKLYSNILINNPTMKKPNLNKWADEIRKLREIDKKTEEQISYMLNWVMKDQFWSTVILSTAKLRSKFDDLVPKVKASKNKGGYNNGWNERPNDNNSFQKQFGVDVGF